MAKRIENPTVDDLGIGGVVLNETEFEDFLDVLSRAGDERQVSLIREHGFFAPIRRTAGFEWAFKAYGMQSDITVMAVCREDSLEAMKSFIAFQYQEGSWPEN